MMATSSSAAGAFENRKFITAVALGLTGTLTAFVFYLTGWLDVIEYKSWDRRVSLTAEPGEKTDQIRLILLDQNSLDWGQNENGLSWPWPREIYAVIAEFCHRAGARALAFDVLFTEPSSYGVEDDTVFGQAVRTTGNTVLAAFFGDKSGKDTRWPLFLDNTASSPGRTRSLDMGVGAFIPEFRRATFPVELLAENAALVSNVHLNPDPDGVYRRIQLLSLFDGYLVPALGLGTFLAAEADIPIEVKDHELIIGRTPIPLDRQGAAILNYRGHSGTHKAYSAAAVLQSEIRLRSGEPPVIENIDDFRDKYVLFGLTAPGLFDLRSSPVGGVYPGVEIQATLLDNILTGDFIRETPMWITVIYTALFSVACAVSLSFSGGLLSAVGICSVFGIVPVLISILACHKGFWLPLVIVETGVLITSIIALSLYYTTEGRRKRFIKSAFRQYLSPAVIEQLIREPGRLKLGGERRVLSIFFSDLQGFTSISEGLEPEALTRLLNEYLTAMTDIIHEEGGTVDKYEGDAIIAFWNAPLEVDGHAEKAIRAALKCQAELARMRPAIKSRIGRDLYMRIGINTGPAVVGNLGSLTRFDYTMLGDSVNLAARLEGANKAFGSWIMVAEGSRQLAASAFRFRELARLAVVGKAKPVTVFEPRFCDNDDDPGKIFHTFAMGLEAFYAGNFHAALKYFTAIESVDPPAAAYVDKCREIADNPPDSWDGVWLMSEK